MGCNHCRSSMARTMEMMPHTANAVAPELARSASTLAIAAGIEPKPPLCSKAAKACSREPYCP